MKKPPAPDTPPSKLAAIGAGIIGLATFAGLFAGFNYNRAPEYGFEEISAPGLEDKTPRPWVEEKGFNLPPVGSLPSLQTAMQSNASLRAAVMAFSEKDDAQIFADYKQTDAQIAVILLGWADANETGRTGEGIDARVDTFLRRAFEMPGLEPVLNNPRLGRDPWSRLFGYYKARLIAQTPGGQAPFTGGVVYDVGNDRLLARGGLNRAFFAEFGAFIRGRPDAATYRDNLLTYINVARPALAAQDRDILNLVR